MTNRREQSERERTSIENTRIGWVNYLNVFPVVSLLDPYLQAHRISSSQSFPKYINTMFCGHKLDIALCSTVTLLRCKDAFMLADAGVCANGAVGSVYLALEKEDRYLQTHIADTQKKLVCEWQKRQQEGNFVPSWAVLADIHKSAGVCAVKYVPKLDLGSVSEASATLARMFHKLWFGGSVQSFASRWPKHTQPVSTLKLYIGDEALKRKNDFGLLLDLSQAWKELAGLPFVFATWLAREPHKAMKYMIEEASQKAQEQCRRDPEYFWHKLQSTDSFRWQASSKEVLLEYWQDSIHYVTAPEEKRSIDLYLALAKGMPQL